MRTILGFPVKLDYEEPIGDDNEYSPGGYTATLEDSDYTGYGEGETAEEAHDELIDSIHDGLTLTVYQIKLEKQRKTK